MNKARVLSSLILTLSLALLTTVGSFLSSSASSAATTLNIVSDTYHREVNGKFSDDLLGESISPGGSLYQQVASAPLTGGWVIDPQLIEEIVDMSDGYTVLPKSEGAFAEQATIFLQILKQAIGTNQVFALPYGSPHITTRAEISEVELAQLQSVSALRLARALDVPVSAGLPTEFSPSQKTPSNRAKIAFATVRKNLTKIGTITSDPEVSEVALRSNALLNPALTRKELQYLFILFNGTVDRLQEKVKILPGNYTLTSTNEEIPITIVNEFNAPAEVLLVLHAENARIAIDTAKKVTIAENSRKQMLITAKAIANGKVRVEARLETDKGARYGETVYLQFTISMLGSAITWVMAGAGILLLVASGIQIYRRTWRSR